MKMCRISLDLHLHPLDLDAPGPRGLVQHHLHGARDALPVRQYLMQVLGAQDITQGSLGQQPETEQYALQYGSERYCSVQYSAVQCNTV